MHGLRPITYICYIILTRAAIIEILFTLRIAHINPLLSSQTVRKIQPGQKPQIIQPLAQPLPLAHICRILLPTKQRRVQEIMIQAIKCFLALRNMTRKLRSVSTYNVTAAANDACCPNSMLHLTGGNGLPIRSLQEL
jgi:hypothetical protein